MNATQPHYHIAGVAGVGMSAIAQVLLHAGFRVSGSDRYLDQNRMLPVLQQLQSAGVSLMPQDGSALNPDTAGIIISTAIEADNPELLRAEALRIPVIHRAEMLARCLQGNTYIAIAGTSGKTTVTGMVGRMLEALNKDPFVVNGGAVIGWESPDQVGEYPTGNLVALGH